MSKIKERVNVSMNEEQLKRVDELRVIFSHTKEPISRSRVVQILIEMSILKEK